MSKNPFESLFMGPAELDRNKALDEERRRKRRIAVAESEKQKRESAAMVEYRREAAEEYDRKIEALKAGKKSEEENSEQFMKLHQGFGLVGHVDGLDRFLKGKPKESAPSETKAPLFKPPKKSRF